MYYRTQEDNVVRNRVVNILKVLLGLKHWYISSYPRRPTDMSENIVWYLTEYPGATVVTETRWTDTNILTETRGSRHHSLSASDTDGAGATVNQNINFLSKWF